MKNFFDSFRSALDSLAANRLRTALTVAVITVGITAIVGIETSLEILSSELGNSFASGSRSSYAILSSSNPSCRRLSWREGELFAGRFTGGTVSLRSLVSNAGVVSAEGRSTDPVAEVLASDCNWLQANGFTLSEGRNFTLMESSGPAPVCLIGDGIRKRLFEGRSPVGCVIKTENRLLTVVGCISRQGSVLGGGADQAVVIPGRDGAAGCVITVIPNEGIPLDVSIDEARAAIRSVRGLNAAQEDDFTVSTADASASRMEAIEEKLSLGALVIGLITLLGAAISLMNVMLVGVKERVKEIGLRKALGETSSSVRRQFMMEAVVIGQAGALCGSLLGILAGNVVALSLDADMMIPWVWLLRAMLICLCVSILAGTMPASRAASLAPVEALRDF